MRSFAILATIYAATVGTTSGLIEPIDYTTWIDVDATGYEEHNSDEGGCDPNGCIPENTRDGSRSSNSRWSCQKDILDDNVDRCCITYSIAMPHDLVYMRIAFHKGDERTRTMEVFDNGDYHSTITSSGATLGYEKFYLNTKETEDLKICLDGDDDEWLSITEVTFEMV